jgi:hypothetical protein
MVLIIVITSRGCPGYRIHLFNPSFSCYRCLTLSGSFYSQFSPVLLYVQIVFGNYS